MTLVARMKIQFSLLLILISLIFGCQRGDQTHTLHGKTMGTTYSIKFVADQQTDVAKLAESIEARLKEINHIMSSYDKTSELSLINQSTSTEWHEVSAELFLVLKESKRIEELSSGAFDITVGPAVNLWGFGPDGEKKLPSASAIAAALKRVGGKHFIVHPTERKVRKAISNLYLDLSAVAKGYGVDAVGILLEQQGLNRYMVEIGGEVRTRGHKDNHESWRIAIDSPFDGKEHYARVLQISDYSIATSGNYRNYFQSQGKLFSHTINPLTATPVDHQLISISVVDSSCMTADALATALMVMGPDKGREFAEFHKLIAYFIYKEGEKIKTYSTTRFTELFGKETP